MPEATIPTTVAEALATMTEQRKALDAIGKRTMTETIDVYVVVGQAFRTIIDVETTAATDPSKVTAASCWTKHEAKLSKLFGRSLMMNQALPLASTTEAKRKSVLNAYLKHGISTKQGRKTVKDSRAFDSTGKVKQRVDLFAECVVAYADKRYDLKTGLFTKKSNAKKGDAGKQIEKASAEVVKHMAIVMGTETTDEIVGTSWDLRYFTEDEMTALEAAIKFERNRRKAGGKVLVES